jgi:hypothetical protein
LGGATAAVPVVLGDRKQPAPGFARFFHSRFRFDRDLLVPWTLGWIQPQTLRVFGGGATAMAPFVSGDRKKPAPGSARFFRY